MTHQLFDLSGRVAVVSGAASGMGRAMAISFAEVGADLMLVDINTEGMQDTASQIEALGQRAVPVTCNVSDLDQIRTMFARLDQEYGKIDILGNVVGEGLLARPEEADLDEVQRVIQSLVIGRFCCCQEAGKACWLRARGVL